MRPRRSLVTLVALVLASPTLATDHPIAGDVLLLKDPANADLLGRWRAGDAASRAQVLADADLRGDPSLSIFVSGTVLAPDVEWFFSARELCALIGKVQDLPMLAIDPGLANREDWAWIALMVSHPTRRCSATS